jgi:hypothetical protein
MLNFYHATTACLAHCYQYSAYNFLAQVAEIDLRQMVRFPAVCTQEDRWVLTGGLLVVRNTKDAPTLQP